MHRCALVSLLDVRDQMHAARRPSVVPMAATACRVVAREGPRAPPPIVATCRPPPPPLGTPPPMGPLLPSSPEEPALHPPCGPTARTFIKCCGLSGQRCALWPGVCWGVVLRRGGGVVSPRLATSVCRLRHDRMEQGPTEPHAGRSTFLLSSGGAGGGYY